MNESISTKFLEDLASLLRKHGPTPFIHLAALLRDDQQRRQVIELLETLGSVKVASTKKTKSPPKSLRESLSATVASVSDPDRVVLLNRIANALAAGRLLATMREVKSFAEDSGFKLAVGSARAKALPALFRQLADQPLEVLSRLAAQERKPEDGRDRTLEAWSEIILTERETG